MDFSRAECIPAPPGHQLATTSGRRHRDGKRTDAHRPARARGHHGVAEAWRSARRCPIHVSVLDSEPHRRAGKRVRRRRDAASVEPVVVLDTRRRAEGRRVHGETGSLGSANCSIRLLPVSTTDTTPEADTPIPEGSSNCPSPCPAVPNSSIGSAVEENSSTRWFVRSVTKMSPAESTAAP